MQYCVTMEQTRRIAVFFDAENDDLAGVKAAQISCNAVPEDFLSGDEERDYALYNQDTGRTVLDWD